MHDTPPPPPIPERRSETLIEDLCIALRKVGVFGYQLPDGEQVLNAINEVQKINQELDRRGVQVDDRLKRLSAETSWRMEELLAECLDSANKSPYVKDADGIGRAVRCQLCQKAERPPDAQVFWMCDSCLRRIIAAIEQRQPCEGIILFRTYSAGFRCQHADSETVLASDADAEGIFGNCKKCIEDELSRRGFKTRPVSPPPTR